MALYLGNQLDSDHPLSLCSNPIALADAVNRDGIVHIRNWSGSEDDFVALGRSLGRLKKANGKDPNHEGELFRVGAKYGTLGFIKGFIALVSGFYFYVMLKDAYGAIILAFLLGVVANHINFFVETVLWAQDIQDIWFHTATGKHLRISNVRNGSLWNNRPELDGRLKSNNERREKARDSRSGGNRRERKVLDSRKRRTHPVQEVEPRGKNIRMMPTTKLWGWAWMGRIPRLT